MRNEHGEGRRRRVGKAGGPRIPRVPRLGPASLAALVAAVWSAVLARADFTYQTTPYSGQIVNASEPLSVRWEVRPGNSPDSNSPAPDLVAVSLGYRDSSGNPKVLFPPVSGSGSTVPLQGGQFTWQKIDFSVFIGGGGQVPLGTNSQFFIYISDQGTGYRSYGQVFAIVDAASATPPVQAPTPACSPVDACSPSPAVSSAQPPANSSSAARPVPTAPAHTPEPLQTVKDPGAATTGESRKSAAPVSTRGGAPKPPSSGEATPTPRPTTRRKRRQRPSSTLPEETTCEAGATAPSGPRTSPPVITPTRTDDGGACRTGDLATTATVPSTVERTTPTASWATTSPATRQAPTAAAAATPPRTAPTGTPAGVRVGTRAATSPVPTEIPVPPAPAGGDVTGNFSASATESALADPVGETDTAGFPASTTAASAAEPNGQTAAAAAAAAVANDLRGFGSPTLAPPSVYALLAVLTFATAC